MLTKRSVKKDNWVVGIVTLVLTLVACSCAKQPTAVRIKVEKSIADLCSSNDPEIIQSAMKNLDYAFNADIETVDLMIEAMIELLEDTNQDPRIRINIVSFFGEMGLKDERLEKVVKILESVLWDEDIYIRWPTYEVLGKIGGSRVKKALENARADDNWLLNPLLKDLQHPNWQYRLAAAWYLGYLADPRAKSALEEIAASDENEQVRQVAEEAVGKIRG